MHKLERTEKSEHWNKIGESLLKKNRNDEALRAFTNAIEQSPNNSIIWTNKAIALEALNRDVESLESIEKALELLPDNPVALTLKLSILKSLDIFEESLVDRTFFSFAKSLFDNPENGNIILAIEKFFRLLNANSALIYYQGMLLKEFKMYSESFNYLLRFSVIEPENIFNWINISILSFQFEDVEEALEYIEHALSLSSENIEANLVKGYILMKNGESDDAIEIFETVLQFHSKSIKTLYLLACAQYKNGDAEDAINTLKEIIEINPNALTTRFIISLIYDEIGYKEEALDAYEEIIKKEPNAEFPWFNRGYLLYGLLKYNEAIASFEKVYQLNPKIAEILETINSRNLVENFQGDLELLNDFSIEVPEFIINSSNIDDIPLKLEWIQEIFGEYYLILDHSINWASISRANHLCKSKDYFEALKTLNTPKHPACFLYIQLMSSSLLKLKKYSQNRAGYKELINQLNIEVDE